MDGRGVRSNDTSPHAKYDSLSILGASSSPRRKNPKKQSDDTAQNRSPSFPDDQWVRSRFSMPGVMGRRILFGGPLRASLNAPNAGLDLIQTR